MLQDLNISTICAPATPPGMGAVSIVRVSGPDAINIVSKIFHPKKKRTLEDAPGYSIIYGDILKGKEILDDVLVLLFRAPDSYTGEDSVEISCHASSYIVSELMSLLLDNGAVAATPGEFTKRAFLNGKMDLAQAEAVADLIACETAAAHKIAIQQIRGGFSKELASMRTNLLKIVSLMELELDFSEEDVQFADRTELKDLLDKSMAHIKQLMSSFRLGNAIKNGVPVAIVGATNTGKSTLLNALVGEERAIVSAIEGTTRDTIEDVINIDGTLFRFIDTAGIRNTLEAIELIGIERTYYKIKQASVVLMMLDATRPEAFEISLRNLTKKVQSEQTVIILINKCDSVNEAEGFGEMAADKAIAKQISLAKKCADSEGLSPAAVLPISAGKEEGLDELRSAILKSQKGMKGSVNGVLVSNARHYSALKEANDALLRVSVGLVENISTELLAQDIRQAMYHLGTIVGQISNEEVLGNICETFCIGK